MSNRNVDSFSFSNLHYPSSNNLMDNSPNDNIPNYCNTSALKAALHRVLNPGHKFPKGKSEDAHKEHLVGTWACTMLKKVFFEDHWTITPEQTDSASNKRPDLVVERADGNTLKPHLFMELKSNDPGIRFEEALYQVSNFLSETMEEQVDVFIVVQCGVRIGFFDYHNDKSSYDEDGISHYNGCVSLTQKFKGKGPDLPLYSTNDLESLRYDKRSNLKDTDKSNARDMAQDYPEPCIFDIRKHADLVNFMFHYILVSEPRTL